MTTPAPIITEADLLAYVDGRLDPDRESAVAAWLEANPEEKRRVESWMGQSDLLRSALDPILDEPVPPALREPFRTRRMRWFVPSAIAAALLIGVGAGLWIRGGVPAERTAQQIASVALSAHDVFIQEVRHPVEVDVSDWDHLVAWLSNRVETEVSPPDLSSEGLALLGGRVIPDSGRPAAMLMYEDAVGERYTLLIARIDSEAVTSFRYAWGEESCAYYWMAGTVAYAFSGPKDRDRMLALSRLVFEQLG